MRTRRCFFGALIVDDFVTTLVKLIMRTNGRFILLATICQSLFLVMSVVAQERLPSVDLKIDWSHPFPVSVEQIQKILDPINGCERPSINSIGGSSGEKLTLYSWSPRPNTGQKLTLFDGKFQMERFGATMVDDYVSQYGGTLSPVEKAKEGALPFASTFWKQLTEALEVEPIETEFKDTRGKTYVRMQWGKVDFSVISIAFSNDRVSLSIIRSTKPQVLEVNLDYLLSGAELWACTPEMFQQKYVFKKGKDDQVNPQFEWLSSAQHRARASRKMFSDVDTRLTMFGKSVKAEEALVEFAEGHVSKVTVSFYNRGDSGPIALNVFEDTFKTVGRNLGQVLKVAPTNQSVMGNAAIKTVRWEWKSPAGVALLEHNDFAAAGGGEQPEFLRLKLASPDMVDWSMGKLSMGGQRMALLRNVTKTDNGDVYISGVPMVDQGAKGYCVAASCQRLFEYMQIPCDQHEIAQLVNVDSSSGADISVMQKSLGKIDDHYKVNFKAFINPEQYYSRGTKRKVSQRQFASVIKESIDKGMPLLWALQLGQFPEVPPLPGDGQMAGGHMRLVIGYNAEKNEVLFTDSWGAGHELKRMVEVDAYDATLGLYSMSPRGF